MGDHYIPKYYLKGFSIDPETELIWVYQKEKYSFKTTLRNVAQENRFYSQEMETYLANEVEAPANQVIEKIRNLLMLTQKDKLILSNYMMVLWKRVPQHKQWVKDKAPDIINPVIDRIEQELIELGRKNPTKLEVLKNHREKLNEIRNSPDEKYIQEIWSANIPADKTSQSSEVLSQMTWRFLLTEKEQYFFTSDNPLFFFSAMGIGKEKSEVTFPITKHIALWATWRTDIVDGFYSTRPQVIKEINRRTASNFKKYIYSPCSVSWIQTLVNKNNHKLNRIV